jgi:hypothetical protein
MNANRLINMAINMVFRHGMRWLNKGQKVDPRVKKTQQTMKAMRKIDRLMK